MAVLNLVLPSTPLSFSGRAGDQTAGDSLYSLMLKLRTAFGAQSVSATLSATQDNFAPAGYTAGTTNRLLLSPASGGSTINGLLAAPDNFQILLVNVSTTDSITFGYHASSTSTNQFACPNAVSATLAPSSAANLIYVTNQWFFT